MGQKVTFNPITKIIQVDVAPIGGVVELDIQVDIYSDGKEDWRASADLFKHRFPVRSVGGDTTPTGSLGATFFLDPPWKIRAYEADHIFRVEGNFYSEDGASPFTPTIGIYNVFLEQQVSNLTDATVAQLTEIEQSSFGDTITVKVSSPNSGTTYPTGTPQKPVNNMTDAHSIAEFRGLKRFTFLESMIIDGIDFSGGHTFHGISPYVVLTLNQSANLLNCGFNNITIQGEVDGMNSARDCFILNVTNASGVFHTCAFGGNMTLNGKADMFDCYSRVEGGGYPTFASGSHNIVARNHKGSFGLLGATTGHLSSIGVYGGRFIAENTCIGGEVHVRGEPFEVIDNSEVGCNVIKEMVSPWNSLISEYNTEDTFGHDVGHIRYIEHSVWVDTELASNGDGSQHSPFNNVTDAIDFTEATNVKQLLVTSDLTIDRQIKNFVIRGIGTPTIDCNGQNLDGSEISHCTVTGLYTGNLIIQESNLVGTLTLNGFFENCAISTASLVLLDGGAAYVKDCSAFVKGQVLPTFDIAGVSGTATLIMTRYDGGLKVLNASQPTDDIKILLGTGRVVLDSSCVDGNINVGGITHLVDNSLGSNVFSEVLDPHQLTEVHMSAFNKRFWNKIDTLTLYDNDTVTPYKVFDTDSEMSVITPQ